MMFYIVAVFHLTLYYNIKIKSNVELHVDIILKNLQIITIIAKIFKEFLIQSNG